MEALDPAASLAEARDCLRQTQEDSIGAVPLAFRDEIDAFLVEHGPIALTRDCVPGHLTASCLLWNATGTKVLLHHHRKLGLWLQFGGHCDGDGDTRRVATRETVEESGIEPSFVTPAPIDFDIHSIPARPAKGDRAAEPEHLHLDVRYLALAPADAVEQISDESLELRWFTPEAATAQGLDLSLQRMLNLGPPRPALRK
ncbi:NUDIX domain protein [Planctomycetes bacterium Poly30]|uniref:NUDIX domain protein n=1 Tax=Saltatorellus ferox TaxID=2528018 RepID=A0A518ES71_9BACT|nr:NUDIX domain protein [Planctomycetes bacterium Poly30]